MDLGSVDKPTQLTNPMIIIDIPTEQTTAVTDVFLAMMALIVSIIVYHIGHLRDMKKALIWTWAFSLLAVAAIFGAAAHGFQMTERTNFILWQPINLSLGLTVALFSAGVVYDLKGFELPRVIIPAFILTGLGFYFMTILFPGAFIVFILYEAVAMLFALVAYLTLSFRKKNSAYWFMAAGILISIIASGIQATNSIRFTLVWEFDHNGIFHLVQMIGLVFLLLGLRSSFLTHSVTKRT
jgi:hypothetical protein